MQTPLIVGFHGEVVANDTIREKRTWFVRIIIDPLFMPEIIFRRVYYPKTRVKLFLKFLFLFWYMSAENQNIRILLVES